MMTMPARTSQVMAALIAASGLLLLFEMGRSVQWNVLLLERSTLLAPRFSFYVWTGFGLALLLMIRGVSMARSASASGLLLVEGLVTLAVAACVVVAARGARVRTDMGPADRLTADDAMPLLVRVLVTDWMFYTLLAALAVVLAIAIGKSRRETGPQ